MPWSELVGHEDQVRRLRAAQAAGRLHPALLFEGPEGIGKRLVATILAQSHHCSYAAPRGGDPCGECAACRSIGASVGGSLAAENQSAHPGIRFVTLSRPDEREARFGAATSRGEVRSQITVSQIRVVLAEAVARGAGAPPRFVVIDPADRMGDSAANALLKTLEEPPAGERFILLTARASALLPTIVSRCCRFRFGLLSRIELRRALISAARSPLADGRERAANGGEAELIASIAGGRVGRALQLATGAELDGYRQSRDLVLDAFEALASGLSPGIFAITGAAAFRGRDREDWLEAIGLLEMLLRDICVLAADSGAEIANADRRDRLSRLARQLADRAARGLRCLDAVRSDLRVNVNGRLAAERILIEVAR